MADVPKVVEALEISARRFEVEVERWRDAEAKHREAGNVQSRADVYEARAGKDAARARSLRALADALEEIIPGDIVCEAGVPATELRNENVVGFRDCNCGPCRLATLLHPEETPDA